MMIIDTQVIEVDFYLLFSKFCMYSEAHPAHPVADPAGMLGMPVCNRK